MRDKYCLPIIAPTAAEAIARIERHEEDCRFFELWLDYLDIVDGDFIRHTVQRWPGRIILVFRRQQLEPMQLPLDRRLAIIRLCHKLPVLVDLDWASQRPEQLVVARERLEVQIILSHHDYRATPANAELNRLARRMLARKPYILKIATFCNTPEDCLRLLNLLLRLQAKGQRCVILGMGEHGTATRIFGTLWANEFIFAPPSLAAASAPGQLTRQQLETISNILGKD